SVEEAFVGLRFTYIGGCFLLPAAMFLIFHACGIEVKPLFRVPCFAISSIVYVFSLTIGYNDLFYVGTPDLAVYAGAAYLANKGYGVMHHIFYAVVALYYVMTIAAIVYSFFKKKQVPRTILILIAITVTIAMLGFFGGRLITKSVEMLPTTYNIGLILYLVIASRLRLYDVPDAVIDALLQKGDTGFLSLDNKMRYLGSNDAAKTMLPELNELIVDKPIQGHAWFQENFLPYVEEFLADSSKSSHIIYREEKVYRINVNRLLIGKRSKGYQFIITDDTAAQKYIDLIKNYNDELKADVESKTASILAMQNRLVLGMATMVEGRDNSTGGHIKRTSDGVRILLETMQEEGFPDLDPLFVSNLIKAAPMHDLGKIAVPDQILRKPGRFTPEEFAIMKTHAPEGARILTQILDGSDDADFQKLAINVAHYHHERYDGSGYPEGLKGEEIPFEARIMAIADVYDALVSKRVYKESMSFKEANRIMSEGMGSQFDPSLEKYYQKARPRLEGYYSNLEN
ncbi:MAG: HD domain-containing protein, partial [Bacilli bacterium]|nr:HD domain-containing protein [Bacilli bacterium]